MTVDYNTSLQPTNIAIIKLDFGGRRVTNWKIDNILISLVVSTKLIFLNHGINKDHPHLLLTHFYQGNVERLVTESNSKYISGVSTYSRIVQIFGIYSNQATIINKKLLIYFLILLIIKYKAFEKAIYRMQFSWALTVFFKLLMIHSQSEGSANP